MRGEVGRSSDAFRLLQVGDQLLPSPRVVPERNCIRARGEDPLGELGGKSRAVRRVLCVDDAEAGAELLS
jgi:hypothetical protein